MSTLFLSKKDVRDLLEMPAVIVALEQACTQLLAHAEMFALRLIKVFDCSEDAVEKLARSFPEYPLQDCSLEETVASDIVCTVTTARQPLLKRKWVIPGTHINAIGADAKGKEELELSILKEAIVVVDDLE